MKKAPSKKLSKGALIIVFLALIRCLLEPFRLHQSGNAADFETIMPFLSGAFVAGISALIMVVFFF